MKGWWGYIQRLETDHIGVSRVYMGRYKVCVGLWASALRSFLVRGCQGLEDLRASGFSGLRVCRPFWGFWGFGALEFRGFRICRLLTVLPAEELGAFGVWRSRVLGCVGLAL